jgi:hypothetical protein
VTYHCINFNDRVRKVPKIKIYIEIPVKWETVFVKSLKVILSIDRH